MKKVFLIFLILIFVWSAAVFVKADVYVKEKFHSDEYYYGGVVTPAEDFTVGKWFGKDKMAYITDNQAIIIDGSGNKMIIINKRAKTYAETELPLDWAKLVDKELLARVQAYPTTGNITAGDEAKKIKEWNCKAHTLHTWIMVRGSRYNETETTVWVTTDVPLDIKQFKALYTPLLKYSNFDAKLITEFEKISGFPVAEERITYSRGDKRKSRRDVVEVSIQTPPPGTYSVPKGFTKKDKLSMRDLRNR